MNSLFRLHHSDRQVILALLAVAVIAFGLLFVTGGNEESEKVEGDTLSVQQDRRSSRSSAVKNPSVGEVPAPVQHQLFQFDPNTADSTQLLRLGLEAWQVRNIYKYRAAGGVYRKKEDFAKLYGLTAKQYRELEPYITISADYQPAAQLFADEERPPMRDTLRYPIKLKEGETIDLSVADTLQLKRVPGIGSYYARRIKDYGERLGGYVSVEQLNEIEGFPATAIPFFSLHGDGVKKLNLNQLSLNELRRHPYINYYQARAITEYRRLHGKLKSLDDLKLLNDFDDDTRRRLQPYVSF